MSFKFNVQVVENFLFTHKTIFKKFTLSQIRSDMTHYACYTVSKGVQRRVHELYILVCFDLIV